MPQLPSKPPFSIENILGKIRARNIDVSDEQHATSLFTFKNYYRYLPYIKLKTSNPNAPQQLSFENIERRYAFDKKLRQILK